MADFALASCKHADEYQNLTTTKHMIFQPQKLEANENVRDRNSNNRKFRSIADLIYFAGPEKTIGGRYP